MGTEGRRGEGREGGEERGGKEGKEREGEGRKGKEGRNERKGGEGKFRTPIFEAKLRPCMRASCIYFVRSFPSRIRQMWHGTDVQQGHQKTDIVHIISFQATGCPLVSRTSSVEPAH
jgi:hypothetical protein